MRKGHLGAGHHAAIPADSVPGPADSLEASEPADVPRASVWLKVAVILVVAMLCIAFAGLIWSILF